MQEESFEQYLALNDRISNVFTENMLWSDKVKFYVKNKYDREVLEKYDSEKSYWLDQFNYSKDLYEDSLSEWENYVPPTPTPSPSFYSPEPYPTPTGSGLP